MKIKIEKWNFMNSTFKKSMNLIGKLMKNGWKDIY